VPSGLFPSNVAAVSGNVAKLRPPMAFYTTEQPFLISNRVRTVLSATVRDIFHSDSPMLATAIFPKNFVPQQVTI
jgi:hypothetical protein